jgi:hypothetical protein
LAHEVEAEVDLYLMHLFMESGNTYDAMPILDYIAGGFDKPGITVLFGGDHGNKNCPISCKLNLSPPAVRKKKKLLSYQCPMITFASIQCSKDSFDLMDNTVMPIVKQQLLELKRSSLVVVYHQKDIKCFRSYMVPSTIRMATIAFIQQPSVDGAVQSTTMTFAYGNNDNDNLFGSIMIDDPVFAEIPFFDLVAKLIITSFNELFIGDLAFLAMLIGMNNSSGSHCLMCMFKGSQFNCNHNSLTKWTKESLMECLEEYMLLVAHPTKKAPPNVRGVNCAGLWDIDPQRIIIPILHCPMGLINKVLESFKIWVNLDVEDFHNDVAQEARSTFRLAKIQHETAIQKQQDAMLALSLVLNVKADYPAAKALERAADRARKEAKKAESEAKQQYDQQMQRHNAKKNSLNQKFEDVYRLNGIKREHYHGGKFNGVNCIRIIARAKELLLGGDEEGVDPGFLQLCLLSKETTVSEATVWDKCKDFARILGLLDAVWSSA